MQILIINPIGLYRSNNNKLVYIKNLNNEVSIRNNAIPS
jgi:hypothetical protein